MRSGGWNEVTGDFRRVWQFCNVYGPLQEKRLIIRRRRTFLARFRMRQFARSAAAGVTSGNVPMPRAMMMAAASDDIR
jgi:hypothetical protein